MPTAFLTMTVALLALAPATGATPARVAHHAAQAAPLPNVLLARGRSEPAMALDRLDSGRVVVAANPDYFGLFPHEPLNGTFASSDDGAAWAQGTAPTYGRFTGVADPSLAMDTSGHAYYLYMGETPSYCGESGNVALLLARSSDSGRTFEAPTVVDVNSLDDKPFIAVRPMAGRPTVVYVTFSRWYAGQRRVLFTRSVDGGRTFAAPRVLDVTTGVDFDATPITAPGGRVYVIWAHYLRTNYEGPVQANVMLRASMDGGRSFGPVVTVAAYTGLPQMLEPGALRLFPLPTAAADRRGTLYVAWVQARSLAHPAYTNEMDADLVLVASRDGGHTWTQPVVLNDTPLGDRFMPALTASGDGNVQVAFYDRRSDHIHFGLYGVAAHDTGRNLLLWPNQRISATLSSPYWLHYIVPGSTCVAPGRFMGDYIAAATSADGALDVAWDDTALGHPQETDLWFCSVPATYLRAGAVRTVPW